MPDRKPNYFARVLAVLALVVAFMLVVLTLATSGGDGGGDDGDDDVTTEQGTTRKGDRAVDAGVWILREGDTLTSISEETGIDIDDLEAFNPDIDAQTLSPGQRIALREGGADEQGGGDDSPGPDGSGVGDDGPTGSSEALDDAGSSDTD
jgi:hypothetical protein